MSRTFDPEQPVILALASPRRRELMKQAGYRFEVVLPRVEEVHEESQSPRFLTRCNALTKALEVAARHPSRLVIGADTLVAIDGCALGKPASHGEAQAMLTRLAGRTHEVCTSVVLARAKAGSEMMHTGFEEVTRVTFLPLTEAEVRTYLDLIDPFDKAGGYAAQDHGDRIICGVDGSWTNVVGLPMERLALELQALGIHPATPTAAIAK